MNCKPGDLAVIVRCDYPENVGRFVRVVCRADGSEFAWYEGEEWECEPATPVIGLNADGAKTWGLEPVCLFDAHLRPIRDNDGEDEILRIAGKPVKEHSHA